MIRPNATSKYGGKMGPISIAEMLTTTNHTPLR